MMDKISIKLSESQLELWSMIQAELREETSRVIRSIDRIGNRMMNLLIRQYAREIDVDLKIWRFDPKAQEFVKREKKSEQEKR